MYEVICETRVTTNNKFENKIYQEELFLSAGNIDWFIGSLVHFESDVVTKLLKLRMSANHDNGNN